MTHGRLAVDIAVSDEAAYQLQQLKDNMANKATKVRAVLCCAR